MGTRSNEKLNEGLMVEVKGEFEVKLSKAIDVVSDFTEPGLVMCKFQMDDSRIMISPLKISEPEYDDEDYEPAKLMEIKVWIIRNYEFDITEKKLLPHHEEKAFEKILIESIRRFVTLIKHKTRQWDLDTRHPVYAHRAKFWYGDNQTESDFPLPEGDWRLPEYSYGTIIFTTRDAHDELSRDTWQTVVNEISHPVTIPPYEELLSDANSILQTR
jgi:hypothetical protein